MRTIKLPKFSFIDQHGQQINTHQWLGKEYTVVYFYPFDFTPTCTKQACEFRDNFNDFREMNAKIIGVSSNDNQSHQKFAAKHNLPFHLAADESGELRKKFGVERTLGILPSRVTFVFAPNGDLIGRHSQLLNAKNHINKAKEWIRLHKN